MVNLIIEVVSDWDPTTRRHISVRWQVDREICILLEGLISQDFYEALKAEWEQQQERHAQKRKASGRIEFTSGATKQKTSAAGESDVVSDAVQRARAIAAKQKSKWDSRPLSR